MDSLIWKVLDVLLRFLEVLEVLEVLGGSGEVLEVPVGWGGAWGVGRVLLKRSKPVRNLVARTSEPPEPPRPSSEPRQNLVRTLPDSPCQNLRTSERDPRRFWRFWRGLGEVFGGSRFWART